MLGCPPYFGDCNNEKAKPLKGTIPYKRDSNTELINKTKLVASWTRKTVYWRRAFMLSLIIVVGILWIMNARFPTERELILGLFVAFSVLCFSFNFYQFHLNDVAENRIDNILNDLNCG